MSSPEYYSHCLMGQQGGTAAAAAVKLCAIGKVNVPMEAQAQDEVQIGAVRVEGDF
ncbi:hypothetical protein [Iodobacter fluviatilis]|uniref:hypothetical protein n=1 Tax=Iodobacter fluviatilis TaxID=537 RepID=UPI00165E893F|nr:hypothetical protein [Iodobacter fluviatilis]